MDDGERPSVLVDELVGRVEATKDVAEDADDDCRRDVRAARRGELEEPPHGDALDELHDDEELAVCRDDIEGRDDVGMLDPRGEGGLVQEHRRERVVGRQLLVHALHGDQPRARGAPTATEIDGGHSA